MPSVAQREMIIRGGVSLNGSVRISGGKNAALPAIAAALLTDEDVILQNVPHIDDVDVMMEVIRALGGMAEWTATGTLRINAAAVNSVVAPSNLVVRNRASFLVMGPLLGRFHEAACCPPGGDVIGQRPLDVHLAGFRALGAQVARMEDKYHATATQLTGAPIFLDYPSNMGTENLLLAAVLADGVTVIRNAAAEPEIACLAGLLNAMGAQITGAGSHTVTIHGSEKLHGAEFRIMPDRIEAGTFAVAAALTNGDVLLEDVAPDHLDALLWKLGEAGVCVDTTPDTIRVRGSGHLGPLSVQALPYPGFATDLQAPLATLLTQATGHSVLYERVYDNRLLYVSELRKMGAEIVVAGQTAIITGPTSLIGTHVRSLDIRCAAALVLAGLVASGTTVVSEIWHLERGYERFAEKLQAIGGDVRYSGSG